MINYGFETKYDKNYQNDSRRLVTIQYTAVCNNYYTVGIIYIIHTIIQIRGNFKFRKSAENTLSCC